MGIRGVICGDVQLCGAASGDRRRLELAFALEIFIGDVDRGCRDRQVIIAVATRIGATGGRHIDDQNTIARQDVAAQGVVNTAVHGTVEGQRNCAVIGIADGDRAYGATAHGRNAAGDGIGCAFVHSQVFRTRAACRAKGEAQLDLGDVDVAHRQVGQSIELDRTLIPGTAVNALACFAAGPGTAGGILLFCSAGCKAWHISPPYIYERHSIVMLKELIISEQVV